MGHKAGDRVKIAFPAKNDKGTAFTRDGIVKFVSARNRFTWYCVIPCGQCGPGIGDGGHRLGMFGSYEAGTE